MEPWFPHRCSKSMSGLWDADGIRCSIGTHAVDGDVWRRGLASNDPATIIGTAAVFTVNGFVAALLPAVRASKIDPIDALRHCSPSSASPTFGGARRRPRIKNIFITIKKDLTRSERACRHGSVTR